jgi:hypothetical protein
MAGITIRPTSPWAISPSRKVEAFVKGAELPIPEGLRLQAVQYTDNVRNHIKHGGTLDTLDMPPSAVQRYVLQTDTNKAVYREVVLPAGARMKHDDEAAPAGGATLSPRLQKSGRHAAAKGTKKDASEAVSPTRALGDSRTRRVLMFYELQAALKEIQAHPAPTGVTARLSRKLQRRVDEVGVRHEPAPCPCIVVAN